MTPSSRSVLLFALATSLVLLPGLAEAKTMLEPNVYISVEPLTITLGQSVNLQWSVTSQYSDGAAGSCTSQGFTIPNPNEGYAGYTASGSIQVKPTEVGYVSYGVTCAADGWTGIIADSNSVHVLPAPTASLAANPATITNGDNASLASDCENSTSGSISSSVGSVNVPTDHSTVSPSTTTKYTLTCTNAAGSTATASATVTVNPAIPPSGSADLTAGAVSPTSVAQNTPTSFSSVITNLGSAATSGPFPVLYQLGTGENDDGTLSGNISNIGIDSSASTLAGNSATEHSTMDSGYTFTSAGTYYVRACANTTDNQSFDVAESNTGNNCGPATAVTISGGTGTPPPTNAADLTILEPVTYETPVATNEQISYSDLVQNVGGGATESTFPVLFQWANDSSGSGAVNIGVVRGVPALPAGPSEETAGPFTYAAPTAGTFYIRACANTTNNSTFGPVNEGTNTGNNCGPWTEVDVSGQAANTSISCSAYPGTIVLGSGSQTVTYTASPSKGVTGPYTWTAPDETFDFGSKITAKRNFSAALPTVYQMSVSGVNPDGSETDPALCQPNVHVETAQEACGTLGGSISASPVRILSGGTTAITWSATSAQESCAVTDESGNVLDSATTESCADPLGDTKQTGPLTTQTLYTLTCDGTVLDTVLVNVVPTFKEF